jgi:hypothetical protein
VITEGVTPSLHVDYKRSRIKQYHKEGQASRTETTINDTRNFGVGRLLKNLPELRRIGFAANRRLLEIEQISHDCALGDDAFQHLQKPRQIEGQRAPALRFGDANAQAVLNAVLMFVFVARGFTNKDLRQQFAVLLGKRADEISPGRMSYELRRLRLHGLIERLPKTHRYRLTDEGLRTVLFFTRVYARILRPVMAGHGPGCTRRADWLVQGDAGIPCRRGRGQFMGRRGPHCRVENLTQSMQIQSGQGI